MAPGQGVRSRACAEESALSTQGFRMLLASPSACLKLFQEKRKWGHGRALLFEGVIGGYHCPSSRPYTPPRTPGLERGLANLKIGQFPSIQERSPLPLLALPLQPPWATRGQSWQDSWWTMGLGWAGTEWRQGQPHGHATRLAHMPSAQRAPPLRFNARLPLS